MQKSIGKFTLLPVAATTSLLMHLGMLIIFITNVIIIRFFLNFGGVCDISWRACAFAFYSSARLNEYNCF